jgi:hypothetical protein
VDEHPGAGAERGEFHRLRPDHEARVDAVVDRAERLRVVGGVVRAVGYRRDLPEHRLVELGVDLETLDLERRTGRAADADRVDPDAAVGSGLGRGDWIR